MSGHSKWHSIKHKKAATDSKRGRIFTRLIKEMTVAARNGGGDIDSNPRLRLAVSTAKANNMPADNIKKAIMRGTGELPGVTYEDITYEGYGPGGVAIIMRTLTDNKNRTVSELRHLLDKNGGNLGANGSVAWKFERKGYFVVEGSAADEEKLMEVAIEAGADDVREDGDNFEILSAPESFDAVRAALEAAGIATTEAEISMIPQNYVKLEGKNAQTMLKLMDTLEDHEDIQNVWSDFDVDESEIGEG
ncbi:MAG: YebC/PmpR family DNA-binding transcriptional regulator [Acidobacteriota bacterium]|jgi:YebC/PmpR family DNA-binding regulatory protein|nr:YebC/PmpR family DNA-binding transcriptional regulator [Acidobacteriota bacterium]